MDDEKTSLLSAAIKYSIPVLLGYLAIGFAFGLLMEDAGYPMWLTTLMSVLMYAGAGQYIAVGLFSAGTTLWEAALVQLVVNARHIAYGLSMIKRLPPADSSGKFRYKIRRAYCIFGLTDETFALLSSLPEDDGGMIHIPGISCPIPAAGRSLFMFIVTLMDHIYWITGSLLGSIAGSLISFSIEGISFALTALFIVLMLEQFFRIRKPVRFSSVSVFIVSAAAAVLGVFFLPSGISLLSAITLALAVSSLLYKKEAAQ